MPGDADWVAALEAERAEKNRFFGDHPHSPIPEELRGEFEGLEYFPPDPAYRFERPLDAAEEPGTVTVATTAEGERDYFVWGEFSFTVAGEDCVLEAYRADPDEDRLWVPFRDATNGADTYAAGRYLDLEAPDDVTDDGDWVLDFNRAYNPYCAYSAAYECPLIPMVNWLDVRIEAGEKAFPSPAAYRDGG